MTDVQADSQAHRDYLESRILSAHPVEVVHMLYQVAIDSLNAAIACLRTGDNFGRSRAGQQGSRGDGRVDVRPGSRQGTRLWPAIWRSCTTTFNGRSSPGHTQRSEAGVSERARHSDDSGGGLVGREDASCWASDQAAKAGSEARRRSPNRCASQRSIGFTGSSRRFGTGRDWSC